VRYSWPDWRVVVHLWSPSKRASAIVDIYPSAVVLTDLSHLWDVIEAGTVVSVYLKSPLDASALSPYPVFVAEKE